MKAWVLHEKEQLLLEDRPMPVPKDGEVLIKIKAMGICGSDVHFYTDLKIGDATYTHGNPLILGHECAGEIVAVGKACKHAKVGDRVVVEPGKPCMHCEACRSGHYNFCPNRYFMGTYPDDGCMCEYVAWPEFLTYKMPDTMSWQEGSMVEPFVVGLQAVRNSGIGFSDTAAVLGTGTIGLMVITALKVAGVSKIIAIGRNAGKLEIARKVGATHLINSKECKDVQKAVFDLTDGLGAPYVFECVGSNQTFWQVNDYAREGGTVIYVGLVTEDGTPMPMASMVMKGLTYKTVMRYTNLFDRAIMILENKQADILQFMTNQYPFLEGDIAFQRAVTDKKTSIKSVINF